MPVKTNQEWTDLRIEARAISTKRVDNTIEAMIDGEEVCELHEIDLNTHGYEIYNDAGVMVEKFVTAIKEEDAA